MLIVLYYSSYLPLEAMIGSRIMRMPSEMPSWSIHLIIGGLFTVIPDIITVTL